MNGPRARYTATVRAHGSLNDFRPRNQYTFDGVTLTKDAVEGVGIPHPEVDVVFLNGSPVDFRTTVQNGDVLDAFPTRFHSNLASPVRPAELPVFRFVVDENSAKLANALLLLGFDTKYSRDYDDPKLAEISDLEKRILLTRDIGLLKRSRVTYGYWIRRDDPREQILEVIRRYDLWPHRRPLERCLECNTVLIPISREEARPSVPLGAWERNTEFFRCDECRNVYWKGSHYTKMQQWLTDLDHTLRNEVPHTPRDVASTSDSAPNTERDIAAGSFDQPAQSHTPDQV